LVAAVNKKHKKNSLPTSTSYKQLLTTPKSKNFQQIEPRIQTHREPLPIPKLSPRKPDQL
jgi:hypothetical protein